VETAHECNTVSHLGCFFFNREFPDSNLDDPLKNFFARTVSEKARMQRNAADGFFPRPPIFNSSCRDDGPPFNEIVPMLFSLVVSAYSFACFSWRVVREVMGI
jgi:hypothetical protein